jgi:hypothetical protein
VDARLNSVFRVRDVIWTCIWIQGCFGLDVWKRGKLKDARRVFSELAMRDVVSWNTMVSGPSGCASIGMWGKAFELLQRVPGANVVTWFESRELQ